MTDLTQTYPPVERDRLSIGGTFKTTFRIFGKAPLLLLLLGLSTQAPVMLRLLVAPPKAPNFDLAMIIVLVVNMLILFIVQTAITYIAVRAYDDQSAPIGRALVLGLQRFFPMLGTTILVILAVYAGLIALIVPGIIVAIIFAVAVPVCAVEGTGPINSMKRSGFLTKGDRWRILGIYCLFFIPLIIVMGGVSFAQTQPGYLVASQWVNSAVQVVWVPLATIFSAAIYAELRRLKESVGVARIFD